MVKIITKDVTPICPHCDKRMETLIQVRSGWFSAHRIYACPHCEKLLGAW